ncbi:hypothetical protein HMPREF1121_00582 [Porphyromonas sp. KLE 1280]|nr:hypothetical protein HMPREF1121_00582 [Porphyromonas sp. KLE 1280]
MGSYIFEIGTLYFRDALDSLSTLHFVITYTSISLRTYSDIN